MVEVKFNLINEIQTDRIENKKFFAAIVMHKADVFNFKVKDGQNRLTCKVGTLTLCEF